jgi:diaminohydroxyphosphoribosylaminopyrimidine deaminase / 5-amino-6-(5-phosphoribosylamino)uracil reductase
VEAGAALAGSVVAEGLADEIVLYAAPLLLGDDARGLLALPGLRGLAQAPRLQLAEVMQIGPDLRLRLRPAAG